MVKWCKICRSKKKGGLGIKNLRRQNISLLVKWWWKLDTQDGLWQRIVKARYLRSKMVSNVTPRFSDSPCWKSLLQVKDTYLAGRKIVLNGGDLVRFWQDPWEDKPPVCVMFPDLFDICQLQECTVKFFVENGKTLPFRRRLHGRLLDQWNQVLAYFEQLSLSNVPDVVLWRFTKNAKFSTKSVYEYLERDLSGADNKLIWKAKLPLKIQIFMWQVFRDAIPTRYNMKKRNWQGNPVCSFCNQVETLEHLFFSCSFAKSTWG
jgi:hypothetical protein